MAPDPFLDMLTIARVYGVTIRTARRWAAADHWRRTTTRPLRYSLEDAQASWERRRASHPRPPSLNILDNSATIPLV